MCGVNDAAEVSPADGGGEPLRVKDEEGAEGGPEAVGAVADGVAQGEIFEEGEEDDGG